MSSKIDIGDTFWVPATLTQRVMSIPNEMATYCEQASFYPVTLVSIEGPLKNQGLFTLDWDSRVEIKCALSDVEPRHWPHDEAFAPEQLEEIAGMNTPSMIHALGIRFSKGQYLSRIGGGANSVYLWLNPARSEIVRKAGGIFQGGCNGGSDFAGTIASMQTSGLGSPCGPCSAVYPMVEKVRQALLSENASQTMVFRGCSGSGKTEAVKSAIQYLLFKDTFANGSESARKVADLVRKVRLASTERSAEKIERYQSLGTLRHPFLVDVEPGSGATASSPAIALNQKILAGLLIFDYFLSSVTEFTERSTRCIKRIKLFYNTSKASSESSSPIEGFDMTAFLVDPYRLGTSGAAKKGGVSGTGGPFLIFPMLMAGIPSAQLSQFSVTSAMRSAYLTSGSGSKTEAELQGEFATFRAQLARAGCSDELFMEAVQSLLCVCHLQSIVIVGSDSAQISTGSALHVNAVEKMTGIPIGQLESYLLKNDAGKLGVIDHKPSDSKVMLEALCLGIYFRVIHWLSALVCGKSIIAEHASMGLPPPALPNPPGVWNLDVFDVSGYENVDLGTSGNLYTLCKNYSNERFAYQYMQLSFDNVVQAYGTDGVKLPNYASPLNETFDAFTNVFDKLGTGLVFILEDVSKSMRPEDKAVLDKCTANHSKSKMVRMAGHKAPKKTIFLVQHSFYACAYDVDGFTGANLYSSVANSKSAQINEFLNKNRNIRTLTEAGSAAVLGDGSDTKISPSPSSASLVEDTSKGRPAPGRLGGSTKSIPTREFLLTRAKDVITRLLGGLVPGTGEGRRVHYMLCFRPTVDLSGFMYDGINMIHQVNHFALPALGNLHKNLLFGCSMSFSEFYRQFRPCFLFERKKLPTIPIVLNASGEIDNAEVSCKILLDECLLEAVALRCMDAASAVDTFGSAYANNADNSARPAAAMFGRTAIYFRSELEHLLEKVLSIKQQKFESSALRIQTCFRSAKEFKRFRKQRASAVLIASVARMRTERQTFLRLKRNTDRMRATVIMKKQRRKFLRMKNAVNVIKRKLMSANFLRIRTRYLALKIQVRTMHMLIRGRLVKKNVKKVLGFVRRLQHAALHFVFLCRWHYKKMRAATRIGSVMRGFISRKAHEELLRQMLVMKKQRIAVRVTTFLQWRFRSKKVSTRYNALRRAAKVVQRAARAHAERKRQVKREFLALWLQCKTRQLIAINKVSFLHASVMMEHEHAMLSGIRQREISSAVTIRNSSASEFEAFNNNRLEIGSGFLKDKVSYFRRFCVGFTVGTSDITTAFPHGLLSTLVKFYEKFTSVGKYGFTTSNIIRPDGQNALASSQMRTSTPGKTPFASSLGSARTPRAASRNHSKEFHVCKMVAGSHHVLLIDDDYNIYGVGMGDGGEFGNASNCSFSTPVLLELLLEKLRKDQHSDLSAHDPLNPASQLGDLKGTERVFKGGVSTLHARGSTGVGVSSSGRNVTNSMTAKMNTNVQVREICCGLEHTLLLSTSGMLWSWGSNWRGQLGHSHFNSCNRPEIVSFRNRDDSKYAHKSRSLDMFGGHVSSGNQFNQSSTHSNLSHFSKQNNNTRFISCGAYHSACVNEDGYLYTWGAFECIGRDAPELAAGSKTRGKGSNDVSEPVLNAFFANNATYGGQKLAVSHLRCGDQHVHCFATPTLRNNSLSAGQAFLYAWGNNSCGQLGIGESKSKVQLKPVRVSGIPSVDLEALKAGNRVGDILGQRYTQIVSNDGPVTGRKYVVNSAVNYPEAVQLRCQGKHVLLLLAGRLWAWGMNTHGQIGNNSKKDCWLPTVVTLPASCDAEGSPQGEYGSKVKSVEVGWNHSSAVCDDGEVFVWGAAGVLLGADAVAPEESAERIADILVPTRVCLTDANSIGGGETIASVESVSCSTFTLITVKSVELPESARETKLQLPVGAMNSYTTTPLRSLQVANSVGTSTSIQFDSTQLSGLSKSTSKSNQGSTPSREAGKPGLMYGGTPMRSTSRSAQKPHAQLDRSRFVDHDHATELQYRGNEDKWRHVRKDPLPPSYLASAKIAHENARMSHRAGGEELSRELRQMGRLKWASRGRVGGEPGAGAGADSGGAEHKGVHPMSAHGKHAGDISNAAKQQQQQPPPLPTEALLGSRGSSPFPADDGLAARLIGKQHVRPKNQGSQFLNADPKSAENLKRSLTRDGIMGFFSPPEPPSDRQADDEDGDIMMREKRREALESERALAMSMFGDLLPSGSGTGAAGRDLPPPPPPLKLAVGSASSSAAFESARRGAALGGGLRAPLFTGRRSSGTEQYSAYGVPLENSRQGPGDSYVAALRSELDSSESYFTYAPAYPPRTPAPSSPEKYETENRKAPKVNTATARDLALQLQNLKNA